ncbi:hypothetical protein [Qipengyuania flava]|uniref:hypothetical protein n=1 Tax=Qipengyuania flava TaxID=192812 RepID=UPI001C62AC6D|nr:hypothetical protein [Qipengyuania flava]QYJ05936.1 hypothetical protein KUV82_07445 [Qipengyuania flava]
MTVDGNPRELTGRQRPGLTLLFDRGARPDSAAILSLVESIRGCDVAYDPSAVGSAAHVAQADTDRVERPQWLELVCDGLSFDVLGLGNSAPLPAPDVRFRVGIDAEPTDTSEAIGLFPGPHIAEGAHALPIIRTLARIGAVIARDLPGVRAVCWGPARLASSPAFLDQAVTGWLEGGPFPALCFVGFEMTDAGQLETEGLSFFIGHELEVAPEAARDRLSATRLAMRLIHELVGAELPEETWTFPAEDGAPLTLLRDEASGRIRVEPG